MPEPYEPQPEEEVHFSEPLVMDGDGVDTVDSSESEKTAFEQDLVQFSRTVDRLRKIDEKQWDKEAPEDWEFDTNMEKDPLSWVHITYTLLKRRGYDIAFTEGAVDTNGHDRPDDLKVFVSSDDRVQADELFELITDRSLASDDETPVQPFEIIVRALEMQLSAHVLPPEVGWDSSDLPVPEEYRELLHQAFLTSILLDTLADEGVMRFDDLSDSIRQIQAEDRTAYERVRESGIEPLGLEEIYGYVNSALNELVEDDPSLRPAKDQQEQE